MQLKSFRKCIRILSTCNLEEFTTKEIAKMLGVTVDTVYKRLERAKKLLKETLERGEQ